MMRIDDLIVTVAYFSIPMQIVAALLKYPRLRSMPWPILTLAILFALFIFLCGTGHIFRCLEMTSGLGFDVLNASTAFISLATAMYLIPLVPHLFESLDSALAAEVESKRKVMTFMSFLCHEIRNPLFAITSTITFLGDDGSLSEEQQSSLECIEQSANLMLRLVNDVLDLSKLESGKLQLEQRTFDLIKVMEGSAASFKSSIALKHQGAVSFHVKIAPKVPRQVIGDSVRILQMIYNLLSNSAKFTEKGFIRFSVDVVMIQKALANRWIDARFGDYVSESAQTSVGSCFSDEIDQSLDDLTFSSKLLAVEDGNSGAGFDGKSSDTIVLKLEVADSGPGISIERQLHIFEPYSQAKLSDYRKHGGTGLGLSIVARLTEIMGGTIHLESTEHVGSTFTMYIPINAVKTSGKEVEPALPIPMTMHNSRNSSNELSFSTDKISREPGIDRVGPLVDDIGSALVGGESSDSSQSIGASVTHAAALNLSFNSSPEVQVNKIFQGPAAGEVSSQDRFRSQVVLVVDDNAINRKLLGRMLKHASVEYFNAENGQEAVDFMKRSKNYTQQPGAPQVGLILMDWSMPVMDGCQATRVIRELNLDVPIVALTACALEEGLQELHNAGANEIVTKPIIRDDLIRICGRYLLGMANV